MTAHRSFGFLAKKQANGAGHVDPHVIEVLKQSGVEHIQPAAGAGDYGPRAADYHNGHLAKNACPEQAQRSLEYLARKGLIEQHWTPAI